MERMKRLVWEEKAAELVEFALAAGIFFTLMFGIIEFCLVVYVGSCLAFAAQQGSRYAMVRGSDWTGSCQATGNFRCRRQLSTFKLHIEPTAPSHQSACKQRQRYMAGYNGGWGECRMLVKPL